MPLPPIDENPERPTIRIPETSDAEKEPAAATDLSWREDQHDLITAWSSFLVCDPNVKDPAQGNSMATLLECIGNENSSFCNMVKRLDPTGELHDKMEKLQGCLTGEFDTKTTTKQGNEFFVHVAIALFHAPHSPVKGDVGRMYEFREVLLDAVGLLEDERFPWPPSWYIHPANTDQCGLLY